MKLYFKTIENKVVRKQLREIIIRKNGQQIFNPSEEMALADGWQEYVAPVYEPTKEELLEQAKEYKLRELKGYDESPEVNGCTISYQGATISYWADKVERNGLKDAVRDSIAMGRTDYRLDLRDKGISIIIPCESLLQMLAALEVYAIDCYNRTTDHEYAIKACQTVEEVDSYHFRNNGYPEQLHFDL